MNSESNSQRQKVEGWQPAAGRRGTWGVWVQGVWNLVWKNEEVLLMYSATSAQQREDP